jgi:UDP-N-acetylglucosamine 2-epimerase (non-hydrolysing)
MTILSVVGTRPEIIKMAPLLPRLDELGHHVIVHSGQHYSPEMAYRFFAELELRPPDYDLGIGSRLPAAQVGAIATNVEAIITESRPDLVIVQGDTNTTLGGALAAAKQRSVGLRLAHVEAGARSHNDRQPEELNRMLVDRMSDLLLTATHVDAENLFNEGTPRERVVVTGNTVVESCTRMAALVNGEAPDGLSASNYAVATIHRQETVDDPVVLRNVWNALSKVAALLPVVLPLHPRTAKRLEAAGLPTSVPGIDLRDPMGYREMITFLKSARLCLTDSGGLQEEAAVLGVPALVLREFTEHQRYVDCGVHRLLGYSSELIVSEARALMDQPTWTARRAIRPDLDHDVTERIIAALTR